MAIDFSFQSNRPLLKEVTADRLNKILTQLRRNTVRGEKGISVRPTGDGFMVGLAASIKGGGAAASTQPWDIYVVDSDENTFTVKVRPGTIAGILPSNWDEEFSCSKDELYYGIATISTDGKNITAISISMSEAAPENQIPQKFSVSQSVQYLFGLFQNGATDNLLGRSINLYPRLRLVTSADPAAQPGESPFDLWYELAV